MARKKRRTEAAKEVSKDEDSDDEASEEPSSKDLSKTFSNLFGSSSDSSGLVASCLKGDADAIATASTPAAAPQISRPTLETSAIAKKRPAADAIVEESAEEEKPKRKLSEAELKEREARTLFVGNVPLKWTKPELRRALRKAVGEKYSGQFKPIWFRSEPLEEKWRGNLRKVGSIKGAHAKGASDSKTAYVVLTSPKDVDLTRHVVHGCVADESHVLRADGVGEASKMQTFDRKRSVFVGNLPASTSEADLRRVFAPAGEVDAIRVIRDTHAKACKGFAFVRFKERPAVKAAYNLWGTELQGRPIRVMKVTDSRGEGDSKLDPNHPAARRIARKGNRWSRSSGAPRKPKKKGKLR